MNQLLANWDALDGRRKTIFAFAAAVAILAMVGVARLATRADMSLLYSGLDAAASGEVIAALEQQNVLFDVRGDSIYVDSSMRDQVRLSLAADGLPQNGNVGYELLDSMSGFGTTTQMFDAAYWRAKEGELARTIVASRDVRAARVHISNPVNQPFARDIKPTASVTATMANGTLTESQAMAIRYLVSSAVSGLGALDVAVIDAEAGVILIAGSESSGTPGTDTIETREQQMKTNVERLLAARVGAGKAVVEVNIDADMDSQTIIERVVDPTSRVAVSSELEENSESTQGNDSGAVTVASNLPDGDAADGVSSSSSTTSQTRERQNFEVSETRRERIVQPGQIRRISVAVMIDGISETAADGSVSWAPRPEEEMTALRSLVESAIGFDPARGDVVTLQSLQFPAIAGLGTLAEAEEAGFLGGGLIQLIQTVVLGAVALVLGLFVIRPILTQTPPPALPAPEAQTAGAMEILDGDDTAQMAGAAGAQLEKPDESKLQNLRSVIKDRSDESADVLRRWIENSNAEGKA